MNTYRKHFYFIITTILIALVVVWVILINDGNYGTTLFFSIPASIGFLIGYSQKYNTTNDKQLNKSIKGCAVTMLVIAALSALLIAIGLEGAICILMAFPYLVIPIFIAYLIGTFIGKKDRDHKIHSTAFILLLLLNPTSYIFDSYTKPIEDNITSILTINKPHHVVWEQLTSEITFKNQPNILFQKGVTYPKSITFNIENNQPNYVCYTNNDTINLDITSIKPYTSVEFKLREQTIPMKELSPYDSIHAKHLHNYFKVNYGKIKLDSLSPHKTQITANTSYSYKIAPKWYWKLWSNFLIDEMQLHVLNSINQ